MKTTWQMLYGFLWQPVSLRQSVSAATTTIALTQCQTPAANVDAKHEKRRTAAAAITTERSKKPKSRRVTTAATTTIATHTYTNTHSHCPSSVAVSAAFVLWLVRQQILRKKCNELCNAQGTGVKKQEAHTRREAYLLCWCVSVCVRSVRIQWPKNFSVIKEPQKISNAQNAQRTEAQ